MRHSSIEGETKTRQEMWLEAFHASEFCKGRAITTERKLELMGVKHEPKEPLRLRVNGINFQLNKQQFNFDIPGELFPENLNRRVELVYDPADMSEVLVTDNKGIRFVTQAYQLHASAVADMTEGGRTRLNTELDNKQRIAKKLTDYVNDRDERLQRDQIDAASIIQANILTKATNHKATKILTSHSKMYLESTTDKLSSIYDEM